MPVFFGTLGSDDMRITTGKATNLDDIIHGGPSFSPWLDTGHDRIFAGGGNDTVYGYGGNDWLYGEAGNDILHGHRGIDRLYGGIGNDTLHGGSEVDYLFGSIGHDYLDGGAGADWMYGGTENDIYAVDNVGDRVIELFNQGFDRVDSYIASYTLPDHVENLWLRTSVAVTGQGNGLNNVIWANHNNNTLHGHGGNDTIYGYAGNDYIDGGAGADQMYGGADHDIYAVDNLGDRVIEAADAGADRVDSYIISYTLPDQVEMLWLRGSGAFIGHGNSLNNTIWGNHNNNVLWGYAGNDRIHGQGGTDTLYGHSGDDYLDGGMGSDRMYGGTGNDFYAVDSSDDGVIEFSGQGIDRVDSYALNYTLPDHVEHLWLRGITAFNGVGNSLDNTMTGNSNNNILRGLAGNDTINGQGGSDTIDGGSGNDIINGGSGNDIINGGAGDDIIVGSTGNDRLTSGSRFDNDVFRITNPTAEGFDRIIDFDVVPDLFGRQRDTLELRGSRITAGGSILAGAGYRYFPATGNLFYDSDGGDSTGSTLVANINGEAGGAVSPTYAQLVANINFV